MRTSELLQTRVAAELEEKMSAPERKLVTKGISAPRDGLRDQGVVHVGLGRKYAAELAACGWTADDTAEIEALVRALGSRVAEQAEAKTEARNRVGREKNAKAAAKEIIGKVRLGASIALGKTAVQGVTMESFRVGRTLGRSTPRIAMYLEKILPGVKALDEHLRPYFGGETASELVASALKDLDAAQADQESGTGTLPQKTRRVYEAKGRLLQRIEEMNRVGRIAFWGRPDILRQFKKDVLLRARKSRK
jgi:hypothetical protein